MLKVTLYLEELSGVDAAQQDGQESVLAPLVHRLVDKPADDVPLEGFVSARCGYRIDLHHQLHYPADVLADLIIKKYFV